MKKLLINLLKIGVSLGIVGWLIFDARRDPAFQQFEFPHELSAWGFLAAAFAVSFTSVTLTIIRWFILVRALELPFRITDALRLGFLCYLLNFISLGSVGGDLFKAVFIAREHPRRRAEAVATVVIDRVIGLYGLFLLASVVILSTGLLSVPLPETRFICQATLICTGVGLLGIVMLIIPGFTTGALSELLSNLPRVGPTIGKLINAVRMYRRRLGVLLGTIVMSMGVHACSAVGIYLIGRGLFDEVPSLGVNLVVVPLSLLAGVLPLPFMGLGAFEAALAFLYENIPATIHLQKSQTLLIAFGYRANTILIAIIGAIIFLFSRREVQQIMHATDAESPLDDSLTKTSLIHFRRRRQTPSQA